MKYKVICSDLDGTLLNSDSELSRENALAIEKLVDMGYLFVPATGRTLAEIPAVIRENKSVRYIIYSNGSGIYDKAEDKYYETPVTHESILKIIDVIKDYGLVNLLHIDGSVRLDNYGYKRAGEFKVWTPYMKLFNAIPPELKIENFLEYFKTVEKIEMLVTFFRRDHNVEAECRERLSKIPGLHVTASSDGNIEIVNKDANKGNAVRRLAEILGISTSEMITAGDSPNDIEMLTAAGLSLAVSGAGEAVKSAASKVACSNDEHIAKYILENLV